MTKKVWIPNVARERIIELAQRIKPVVRYAGLVKLWGAGDAAIQGDLYYIKPVDLFGIAYTWDPKRAKKAGGLVQVADIKTYHRWGHYMLFKPSIAEVLACVPDQYLETAVAFEIVQAPETWEDFCKEREAFDAGYHVATTRLYKQSD